MDMPPLKIGNTVASVPIIQGGMGLGISLSKLAAAVANQGGIGVIAANLIGVMEPDYYKNGIEANKRSLRREIRKARKLSDGIIGVNIMVAVSEFHELLKVSIEEKVDLVCLGAGLPLRGIPVKELREANVKIVPIVSSERATRLIFTYWQKKFNTVPDAVVVEGPMAGGHLGFKENEIHDPNFALENIFPGVLSAVKPFESKFKKKIPVIAAGGIYTGEDIYKYFKMGAGGIQMASRFVATTECDADDKFKEAFVNCSQEDISIIKSPVGLPGRAIKNKFLRDVDSGMKKTFRCPRRCLVSCKAKASQYCICEALDNARKGNLADGFAFAGSNAYRVENIVPVKALMKELRSEYLLTAERNMVNLKNEFADAIKRLISVRDQYIKTVKKSARAFKVELGEMLDKGTSSFREEYKTAIKKLETLKEQYANHFDRVDELKQQLSKYFDISSLKLPEIELC
ncbi:MAG: nitronate monooxygenase [Candidatus Aminicenantes bacterium]|nr:nitronate monooxygenase [Candidatus Aminicenantes bacterium]